VNRNQKDFNCNHCVNEYHCTETVGDENWPLSRGVAPIKFASIPGVIDSNVCLKPMITQASMFYLRMHSHYKNGVLPYSGGLLDQPAVYLQAMELIDSIL